MAEILLYKLLAVKANSIYLDAGDTSVLASSTSSTSSASQNSAGESNPVKPRSGSTNGPLSAFNDAMQRTMAQRCDGGAHTYVLEPTEATFRVTLNRNRANFQYPQFQVESVFQAVSLGLRPLQLQSALFISKRLEYFNTSSRYLQWRPKETPTQNPRAWWKFAIDCVVHEVRARHKPWLPESIDLRRKRREEYVPLFERTINSKAKALSSAEKAQLAELERVLEFDDIMYFRALAEIRVQKDESARTTAASQQQQATWGSWLSSFVWTPTATNPDGSPAAQPPQTPGSSTATPSATASATPNSTPTKGSTPSKSPSKGEGYWESVQLSEEETNQLLDAINFERSSDSGAPQSRLKPPADYVKFKFSWSQAMGELKLIDDSGTSLASFAFHELSSHALVRESQLVLDTTVQSVEAIDHFTSNTHFPKIVYPQLSSAKSPLLQLKVIKNNRDTSSNAKKANQESGLDHTRNVGDHQADWNLDFSLKKLNIIFNASLVKKAVESFKEPFKAPLEDVAEPEALVVTTESNGNGENYWTSWNQTKKRNERLLALATLKPSTNIRIKIEAPNLLVPKDCSQSDSSIVILELGTLTFASKLSDHQSNSQTKELTSTTADTLEPLTVTPTDPMSVGSHLKPGLHITANTSNSASRSGPTQKDIDVSNFYDQFDFSVSNIQLIVSRTERIRTIYGLSSTGNTKALSKYARIIQPLGFNLSLAICKINVESLPNVKVSAALPSIRLIFSSSKIRTAKSLISFIVSSIKPTSMQKPKPTIATPQSLGQSTIRSFSAPPDRLASPMSADSNARESLTKPNTPLPQTPGSFGSRRGTVSQFIGDLNYTQSLADVASAPEEELVALGLGVSIEVDLPEIEITLVEGGKRTSASGRPSMDSTRASAEFSPVIQPLPNTTSSHLSLKDLKDDKMENTRSRSSSVSSDDSFASAVSSDPEAPTVVLSPGKYDETSNSASDSGTSSMAPQPAPRESRSDFSSSSFNPASTQVPSSRTELLCIRLKSLGYRFESHPNFLQSKVFLNSLSVEDFSQPDEGQFRYLITSQIAKEENEASNDLVELDEVLTSATFIDQSLIQLTHTYRFPHTISLNETPSYCKIRFNELQVNLSNDTMANIFCFISTIAASSSTDSPTVPIAVASEPLTRAAEPVTPVLQPSSSDSSLHVAFGSSSVLKPSPTKKKNPESAHPLRLVVEIEIEAIVINFVEKNSMPLAEVSLRGSTGKFRIIDGKGWILNAKLGNANVIDTYVPEKSAELVGSMPHPMPVEASFTHRKHVISVKGPHVIEFTLTNFDETEELPPTGLTPEGLIAAKFVKLDVQINSIRVLINPKWVYTMILNVGEIIAAFSPPQIVDDPSDLSSPVVDYLASPTFFNYKVKILRPFIIFPQDHSSTSVLITDWGEIDVSQSIVEQPLPPAPGQHLPPKRRFRETVTVSLRKANMATGQFASRSAADFSPFSKFENRRTIMGECDILVSISSSLIAHTMEPRQDKLIEVHIGKLNLFLSPEQVKFLIVVVQNSLFYTPTESEIRRKLQAALAAEAVMLAEEERLESMRKSSIDVSQEQTNAAVLQETGRMRIQLEKLVVEAHDHYELFPSRGAKHDQSLPKLLLLEVSRSKIAWATLSDGSLRLGFQISHVNISDLRHFSMRTNRSAYNAALSSPSSIKLDANHAPFPVVIGTDSSKSQIVGSIVTVPTKGNFTVSLTFNHLQFLPEASFLQKTWSNLGPLLIGDLIGLLAHRERIMVSTLTPRQEAVWKSQKFHPEAGSAYSFTLNRPQIVLVTDESSSTSGNWLKFSNITTSSCEIGMRFMQNHQSYNLNLHELSTSVGETFNTSLADLFRPSTLQVESHSPHLGYNSPSMDFHHTIYHYNILSPWSAKINLILTPTVQDYQIECLDIAKLSFSYNDYKNILSMCLPFTLNHLKSKDFTAVVHPTGDSTSSAASTQHKSRPKTEIKEKPTIPTISDHVSYRMIRTDASIGATAVTVAVTSKDPKRATEFWANLDEEKKRMEKDVPSLTLGTAAPVPLNPALSSPRSVEEPHDRSVVELEEEGANRISIESARSDSPNVIPTPPEFVHKKLMVFNPKVQVMLMDNREYDLGVIRTEVSAQECWLQDWGAGEYIAALSAAQLDWIKATGAEIDRDLLPHVKATLRATLSADSFNIKAAAWETLADPIDIDFGLSDRSVVLKSEHALNLTISETFLSSYKRFRSAVDAVEVPESRELNEANANSNASSSAQLKGSQETPSVKAPVPTRHRIQAPYYVRNETGLPLTYRLFPEDDVLLPTDERVLASSSEEPIVIPMAWAAHFREQETSKRAAHSATSPPSVVSVRRGAQESLYRHLDRSAQSFANRHFVISAQVQSFLAATDISVDQIGTQVAHIGQGRLLIVEIQYRLGAKLITFKSRFSIHNNTAFPLVVGKEIKLPAPAIEAGSSATHSSSNTTTGTIKKIATIDPYTMWSIPLDCIADTVLRFRPTEASRSQDFSSTAQTNQSTPTTTKFGWSQMRCEVKNLKPSAPIFVDCTSTPPSSKAGSSGKLAPDVTSIFQYSVGVSRLANKSAILAGGEQLVVHFQPPLVIENLLPATMTFSIEPKPLKRNNAQTAYLPKVGKLKKGQRLPVHQVPAQCYITFRMMIRGFEWTPHILLRKPEALGASAVNHSDSTSGGLSLNTDVPMPDGKGLKLRIQVENLVNELGTRFATFYTDFWIVNKTGLPLLARAHISNPASIGAGMVSLYSDPNSKASPDRVGADSTGYDIVDDRNGSGLYGGDLRDFFMPDLSAGCVSAGVSAPLLVNGAKNGDGPSASSTTQSSAPTGPASATSSTKVPNTAKPIMYCPHGFENKRFHLKVAESRWSESLVLNTQNDSTVFSIYEKDDATRPKRKYELALTIRPAANQFWRTRVVTVAPRYMMINKTPYTIFVRQVNSAIVSTLLPGEHVPFHWLDASKGLDTFRIKWNLPKCTWSGPIDPSQLEMFTLKLFNAETGLRYLIRANVRFHPDSSISTITFKEEDLTAPLFRIDNYTMATLLARQLNLDYATEAIPPLQRRVWGWLQPAYGSHRVQILFNTVDKVGLSFSLAKVKAYPPIQFDTPHGKVWVLAETSTERTTRVLSLRPIPDPTIERIRMRKRGAISHSPGGSLHGRHHSSNSAGYSPAPTAPPSESTEKMILEPVEEEEKLEETLRLQVSFAKVSFSLINAEPLELIYGSLSGIDVTYVNYGVRWSLDLSIGDIQIDNQIPTTFYPVAVFSLGDAPEHWLRFSMIRSYEHADIIYQPFVSLLLRATTIRLDELLVLKLLDLTGVTIASFSNTGKAALLTSNTDVMALGADEDASKMIYNHLYLLNPVALNISFLSSASAARARETQLQLYDQEYSSAIGNGNPSGPVGSANQRQQTNAILGIPDKFIPNVESAPLNLNALLLKHSFVSSDQLRNRILQHYKTQVMRQMYAILGSFEALGNPISLVSNLGTGVKDLFYEPAKGIAISPEEFGAGLRRGGRSFVSKSVAGLFDSTSKVLRAFGSGVAIMSLDDEYQARRDLAKRRDQPTNALAGAVTGLKEFGEGLAEGVAGIFVQPIKGFQQEGALGLAKGVGKGLIGVAVKPVVGTLDLVQRATEGISNTASMTVLRKRMRYPRYISEDGLLRAFDIKNSTAMHILHSIENSAFAQEEYWGYMMISKPTSSASRSLLGWLLIASSRRLVLASRTLISSTSSASSSNTASSSHAVTTTSTPEVNLEWVAPYFTIQSVEKIVAPGGQLKIKISTRNRESVLITHQVSALDVNHCVEIESFIGNAIKKWQALSKFTSR